MNLSGYNQLEQLSDDELDYLETSILARLSGYVDVVRLYVVGSFCFGLDKVNDQCASNPFVSTSIYLQILQLPHVNILE